MLRARLIAAAEEQAADAASAARRSPRSVRSTGPSGSAPTTSPENRIADHRIGFKAYNLDQVLNGDLGAVIAALQEADTAERLAAGRRATRRDQPVRPLLDRGRRRGCARPASSPPAQDARILLAHVCGCELVRLPLLGRDRR